jgi:uncharacterized membrane-anchored protein
MNPFVQRPPAMHYALLAAALLCPVSPLAFAAQEGTQPEIQWQEGPGVAILEQSAEIKLPAGYRFADAVQTRRIKEAIGEPVSGEEMGMLIPKEGHWSVFFSFSDDGYVKDTDKDKLNADKLLESIVEGNEYANEERKKMGTAPLKVIGWEQKPFYDSSSHNLEWCLRAESEGQFILNYNTRYLGRRGVMSVVLVCDPAELKETLSLYKDLLAGFTYKKGETYGEYKSGDKVAKFGLAALVTGGAVAVAAKTGLLAAIVLFFKKGWKLIILGLVAVGAFIKRIVTGDRARPTPE